MTYVERLNAIAEKLLVEIEQRRIEERELRTLLDLIEEKLAALEAGGVSGFPQSCSDYDWVWPIG